MIELRNVRKYGRGLFATRNIKNGEIVERSPVVELTGHDHNDTILNVYVFGWRNGQSAVALGLGSLFNHSSKKFNVTYSSAFGTRELIFVASQNIKKNQQLFIDYGYEPKRGIEVTERNIFRKLKSKFEPDASKMISKPEISPAFDPGSTGGEECTEQSK